MKMLLAFSQEEISQEEIAQAAVIQLSGPLDAETTVQFHLQLNASVESSHYSSLLIDMRHVERIDSAGLMALVTACQLAKLSNKRFCLCSVSPCVRMILELTQLDRVLEILENPAASTKVGV